MRLRPFFSYYGSKWRIAPQYPAPHYEVLHEPFAGSAAYALCYPHLSVYLTDLDEHVCMIWDYLIRTPEKEILALPDIPLDGSVNDFKIPGEARLLIGSWLNKGAATFRHKPSAWMRKFPGVGFWSEKIRERIASQQRHIRHWSINCASFHCAGAIEPATYFVDPPYEKRGLHYRHSSKHLDFAHLSQWCRSRTGQVIVCENEGATWLPFRPFLSARNSLRTMRLTDPDRKVSREALWESVPSLRVPRLFR